MKKILFYFCGLILFFLFACNNIKHKLEVEKEYQYLEQVKERGILGGFSNREIKPEIIKATTDSIAYIKAFRNFCISKKVRKDMEESNMETYTEPISFKLLNEQGKDIRYIYFENKESIETNIEKEILDSSNQHK